jgi:carbamoyl-phosphate synthase small subunit
MTQNVQEGILLLEDGTIFRGRAFGATTNKVGEVVFNTAMTGYQEALTDPSYAEQILVMTYPHIGNTGINSEDVESERLWVSGFVARRFQKSPSNFRSEQTLEQYLISNNIPGIEYLDTRALVRKLRDVGAMKGVLSTSGQPIEVLQEQLRNWGGMVGRNLAEEVCGDSIKIVHKPNNSVATVNVIDSGCKNNIVRLLSQANCTVRTVPITASKESWTADCDFIFLSNGPGDPASLTDAIEKIKALIGTKPILGICLGHQLLSLAIGAKTFKLAFGHRGINHPVRDEDTGRVEISSQNHGFCVDPESLKTSGAEVTHWNLNDHTVAGIRHQEKMIMGVQFHPEACPGPNDSAHWVIEKGLKFALSFTEKA